MHEMALCTEITDIVLEEAAKVDAVRVNEVHLVVGELRDVVQQLFDGFFHHLTRGTVAEDAVLQFTTMPATVRCEACGQVSVFNARSREKAVCPVCGGEALRLHTGRELLIASMDVTTERELRDKKLSA